MTSTATSGVGVWLEEKCKEKNLSLRQAAELTKVSHTTLASIKNGSRPTAATIKKLADAFNENGPAERVALEDRLLILAGYRSVHPGETQSREPLARLVDKLSQFDDDQLKMIETIIDFCTTMGGRLWDPNQKT